ncbi:MAG: alanine--tRNA ligase [Candidatus Saliniplasma sp.]
MFEEEYKLDFFEEKGYIRKKCTECGAYFWTIDEDEDTCQDAPCVEFDFIGNPATDSEFDLRGMREYFMDFFSERGHTPLERYPVAARWRDDVFLVHASIYDFQPHATSGKVKPPANPLVVSQPCIRLPDLDEVGKTGKHLTSFEMMGHHSFNSANDFVYWKEETVKYCHEMLLDIGVPEEEIVYKEHPWIGGGNAGPSLEVNVRGLEVATLVFMNMEKDPDGDIELDGERYSPLDLNVVDTGYGVERWAWISNGAPTIYDSLFPEIIDYICSEGDIDHPIDERWYRKMLEEYTKLAGRLEKYFDDPELLEILQERLLSMDIELSESDIVEMLKNLRYVYTIADHSKTIALMLSDGLIPSNVEEGYLVRMMIRRILRQIDQLGVDIELKELVDRQLTSFKDMMDQSNKELVFDILEIEIEKYRETLERGKGLVERELEDLKGDELSLESLIDFYDTHGIHPTIVKELAEDYDVKVNIPENFNSLLAEMHEEKEEEKKVEKVGYPDLPDTSLMYYDDEKADVFDAVVIYSDEGEVILDQTLFYPEGGGQPSDKGTISTEESTIPVKHVRREGDLVVHEVDGDIPKGEVVRGKIDMRRRMDLTRHHTATHLVISSARKVLGKHIWQRGAQKGVDSARIDLSHYKRISRDDVKQIEKLANEMVLDGIPVNKEELSRDEAEERFGFELYQGGVPENDVIRVVYISDQVDYDAQACGGTHLDNTSEVGAIKILNTQRIQDGVERITFTAGMATVEEMQRQEDILLETCEAFSVGKSELSDTARRFFSEWKERGKELEELKKYRAIAAAEELLPGEDIEGVEVVTGVVDMDTKGMLSTAESITKDGKRVVLLVSKGSDVQLVFSRSDDIDIDMSQILRQAAKLVNGGGGGSPKTAQGGGSRPEGRDEALGKAVDLVKKELE